MKLGCNDATMDDIVEAATQANCHDFISEFPKGYKTFLGEGGSLVSGKRTLSSTVIFLVFLS
jgi:ATP-binding cassette subfamily B protein